ncbi:MAG: hypothetical protein ACREKE_01665, partial [bacterium]
MRNEKLAHVLRKMGGGASVQVLMIRYRTALFGAALAAALAFGATWYCVAGAPGVRPTGDLLAVPLDDAAIYFQYAHQALHGEWLRYYPGAPLSTGVTSTFYFVLITLGMGLGLGGPLCAWLLGLAGLLLGLVSADRLARRLFPDCPSWWAGVLLLSQGAWVAAHFNAMETGLQLGLTWVLLDALTDPNARARIWLVLGALSFTRPEGQVLVAVLGGAWSLSRPRRLPHLAVILSLAAAPSLLLLAVSGSVIPDSVRPKAASLYGGVGPLDHAANASSYAVAVIKGAWMGFWGGSNAVGIAGDAASGNPIGPQFPPLTLLGALLGWFWLLRADHGRRRMFALSALAGLAALLGLLAWNLPVGWHDFRYLNCATPLLFCGMLACLQALGQEKGKSELLAHTARDVLFTLWVVFGIASWPWQLNRCYSGAIHYALANTNAAVALRSLPPGPVAVVDSGLLAYYSGREIVDLPGITDHAQAMAQPHGPGAMLETLLLRTRLPVFAALHDHRTDFDLQPWLRSGLLTRVGPLADAMGLYRWNWSGLKYRRLPLASPAGSHVLDCLDVAELGSEKALGARYEGNDGRTVLARMRLGGPGGPLVPEGGRLATGLELPHRPAG